MKRRPLLISLLASFLLGVALGGLFFGGNETMQSTSLMHKEEGKEQVYTCSMHPQIRQNKPGTCPICAMDLIPLADDGGMVEGASPDEIRMGPEAMKLAAIQTSVVQRGMPRQTLWLSGKVTPDERKTSTLTARFAGRIEKLYINYTGQRVRKGEKLALIYSPELLVAQQELLQAAHTKVKYPAIYQAAIKKLRYWNVSEMQIQDIEASGEPHAMFDIVAPIAGTVIERKIAVGDYVREGSMLFHLADLSRLWIIFEAYEKDLPFLSKGGKITYTIPSLSNEQQSGVISYIDPFMDERRRIVRVRVEQNNRDGRLKPGVFVQGQLMAQNLAITEALVIPKSAVLWTGKRSVVYIKVPEREQPTFLYREVRLGDELGNYYAIREGLTEGEEVATNGVFKIDAAAQLAGKKSMMNAPEPLSEEDKKFMKTVFFSVNGNCGMCKETIEKAALSVWGIHSAEWDSENKKIQISYDVRDKVLPKVHKAIAARGYDTDKIKASQQVYAKLPECCQYR